jgi:uncharacterized protein (DUF488 family)
MGKREPGCLGPLPHIRKICTIGFTGLGAELFFEMLKDAGVQLLVDVRRRPHGARTFFTLKRDMPYFCGLHGIGYVHLPELSPSNELLSEYRELLAKKDPEAWRFFLKHFAKELSERKVLSSQCQPVQEVLQRELNTIALMCTEKEPKECHRSLVAATISKWHTEIEVVHLQGGK